MTSSTDLLNQLSLAIAFERHSEVMPRPRDTMIFKHGQSDVNIADIFEILLTFTFVTDEKWDLCDLDVEERIVVCRALFHLLDVINRSTSPHSQHCRSTNSMTSPSDVIVVTTYLDRLGRVRGAGLLSDLVCPRSSWLRSSVSSTAPGPVVGLSGKKKDMRRLKKRCEHWITSGDAFSCQWRHTVSWWSMTSLSNRLLDVLWRLYRPLVSALCKKRENWAACHQHQSRDLFVTCVDVVWWRS